MSTHTQLLGEGAYARVYRHKNEAIKITPVQNEEDLTAIVREQYVLRMHLPNMVPFKRCYYKWNSMHITMEEATSNLNQWFKQQHTVETKEIKRIVIQILQGIFSLHEHKVTHRDLKPDNVLMNGDKIWLCDFGLSINKDMLITILSTLSFFLPLLNLERLVQVRSCVRTKASFSCHYRPGYILPY